MGSKEAHEHNSKIPATILVMNKQGEFRCLHDRIEIEDCSVYCYDCDNEDMTDSEVTELLINDSDKEWMYEEER